MPWKCVAQYCMQICVHILLEVEGSHIEAHSTPWYDICHCLSKKSKDKRRSPLVFQKGNAPTKAEEMWHQREVLRDIWRCRFHIMGGECNYLLRVSRGAERRLKFVPDEEWKSAAMMSWSEEAIQAMLTSAEAVLRDTASRLRLPVTVCLDASHVLDDILNSEE